MEIDGSNPLAITNANVKRIEAPQPQRSQGGSAGSGPDSDRIELSIRGREISQLDELVRSTPDIREFKIEQVRRSIEAGTYNVKAEKIAEKIIGGSLLDEVF
jgi:flagellar biosynthesis anti-sigma factor FlgM